MGDLRNRFKVGDRVRVKEGLIFLEGEEFKEGTISKILNRDECLMKETGTLRWIDNMIEGLVEEEVITQESLKSRVLDCENFIQLPQGYIFKDENGNVINATKIVFEKKEKEYPKLFVDCCAILYPNDNFQIASQRVKGHKGDLLFHFQKLLICRDAYWKIAGEDMRLEKSWEPVWCNERVKYCLVNIPIYGGICKRQHSDTKNILAFPTEEMRDAFYEAFKDLIEECKELL